MAVHVLFPDATSKAHQCLLRLTDDDDVEAYLHTFEVIATREGWVKEEWARIIAPSGLVDKLLQALPRSMRCPVIMRNPINIAELVEAVELVEVSLACDAWPHIEKTALPVT